MSQKNGKYLIFFPPEPLSSSRGQAYYDSFFYFILNPKLERMTRDKQATAIISKDSFITSHPESSCREDGQHRILRNKLLELDNLYLQKTSLLLIHSLIPIHSFIHDKITNRIQNPESRMCACVCEQGSSSFCPTDKPFFRSLCVRNINYAFQQ